MTVDCDARALVLEGANSVPWKEAPSSVTDASVVLGRDDAGIGAIQVGVAHVAARPTKALLDELWKTRGTKTPIGFIVVAVAPEGVWLHYPREGATPLGPVTSSQAERQLQSVLDEGNGLSAHARMVAIQDALASGGTEGFSNHFLFATYHLREGVPRRKDWDEAGERAAAALGKRGSALVEALGFETQAAGTERILVLRAASGSRRAVAVLLNDDEHFAQKSSTYQLTPVAKALEVAGREDVPWVIALRKSTLRLYPGRDGVGVGQRGQSETYFELDLDLLDPEQAALLSLIFSAQALDVDGSAQQILDGSGKYAADLGTRLRDRVYEGVVPDLALAVAERMPALGFKLDADGLQLAYRLTMRILFRLLFQAYGEATELLPAGRNSNYDHNSLQNFINDAINADPAGFSTESAAIWSDLTQVWEVIFHGNARWEVPAYGGSLFDPASEEGILLAQIKLPDRVVGPALQQLLSEMTVDQTRGSVDFRSLQVREFGTIYEGLLESSLSVAEQDLTVDKNGAYIPAKEGDEIAAHAGEPYFHSASGERKATGSYYTPKIVVDHLIERSITPALEAHLERIKDLMDAGEDRQAAEAFFDFRVADLAMGSAHFLVAAVDKIERGMRDFLTATEVPGVRAELARLADKARETLGRDTDAANAITEGQLLRRQVARRCIYGLDINPLAVELSQLALWIHTFVPGLPMSSLDHGLVLANSLTGIGTIDEALGVLDQGDMFRSFISDPLTAARDLLVDYANASEADKSEVAAGAEMLAKAREAAAPAKAIFDVAVAKRLGSRIDEAWDSEQFEALAATREVREAVDPLDPAHMPYLFPEVFLRERPGFDALVGNPPWEELHVAEHHWWGLRLPGLRSMPQAKRVVALRELRKNRPDLEDQYLADIEQVNSLRRAIAAGPFPGVGAAHLDLYQMFGWRNWSLLREAGRAGLVLPRGALSGASLAEWRRSVLAGGAFADVCFLTNNMKWIFPNVHPQYTVGLTVVERGAEHVVRFSGPFFSQTEFVSEAATMAEVPAEEFGSWSETAAFPLIRGAAAAQVLRTMMHAGTFRDTPPDVDLALIQGDLNATKDKPVLEFDVEESRDRIPIGTGASFNIWNPDAGIPYAYSPPDLLRPYLRGKFERATRTSRSAYAGMTLPEGRLQLDRARIVYRGIARATDTRTSIPCLAPPGRAIVDPAHMVVTRRGSARHEAFLLGVMASLPFDWSARRWVELHLTFGILTRLPVPWSRYESSIANRTVVITGRLAAIDERYQPWAEEVGVEVGTANAEPTKTELIAELDALVSLLYGLTQEQVEHVFATFHRGWDYAERLERVLAYYEQWKDAT